MRAYDFAPLYRSTIGFDRMFSLLDQAGGAEDSVASYPPYNIERNGENAFRISVAVAGFSEADLAIEAKENTLTIRGVKQTNNEEKTSDFFYKGIGERTFDGKEAVEDRVPLFRIELLGQLHRTFHGRDPRGRRESGRTALDDGLRRRVERASNVDSVRGN